MPLTTRIGFSLNAELISALDLATASAPIKFPRDYNWGSGTGANSADRIFHDRRTIAASGTDDLDLSGSLLDALGGSAVFARVRGLIVYAATGNTNNVVVGGDANALAIFGAATHTMPVRPGGLLALFAPDTAGYVVTPTTGDILQIANSGAGTSVTYDVVIVGASA